MSLPSGWSATSCTADPTSNGGLKLVSVVPSGLSRPMPPTRKLFSLERGLSPLRRPTLSMY